MWVGLRRGSIAGFAVLFSAALVRCGGGSSSASSDAGGGADASGVDVIAESAPPDSSSDAGADAAEEGTSRPAADAAGEADASEDVEDAAPPVCVPACAHRPCGIDGGDGCGGTCAPPDGGSEVDGESVGCTETAYFTVGYGDTEFGGVCASSSDRNSTSCSAGAKRYCQANQFGTGFPEQTITDAVGILCVSYPATDIGSVPLSTLTGLQSACTSANLYSLDCESAADDYCTGMGYAAGFGPNEVDGDLVSVSCVPGSVGVRLSSVPTSTFEGSCDVGRNQNCDADAANYCTGMGYAGGFGPLQVDGDNTAVICIFAN